MDARRGVARPSLAPQAPRRNAQSLRSGHPWRKISSERVDKNVMKGAPGGVSCAAARRAAIRRALRADSEGRSMLRALALAATLITAWPAVALVGPAETDNTFASHIVM